MRLVVFSSDGGESGYNNTVEYNCFGGGAGQTGNDTDCDATSSYTTGNPCDGTFESLNDPEVMIAEFSMVYFAGRLGAIFGRPGDRAPRHAGDPRTRQPACCRQLNGLGDVVSILCGVNSDGSHNMTYAGQWFRVAQ